MADASSVSFSKTIDLQGAEAVATVNETVTVDGVLMTDNTAVYTPTADYHPSTKKYVDDAIFISVKPSGDATGATDVANIQASIDATGSCQLTAGAYYTNDTINLTSINGSITGIGPSSRIIATANTFPIIKIADCQRVTLLGFRLYGGLYGIEIENAHRLYLYDITIQSSASHGIYGHDNNWIVSIFGGYIGPTDGDGINMLSAGGTANVGNALYISGTTFEACTGHPVNWGGVGLNVMGCCIEGNGDSGIKIAALDSGVVGVTIVGNYFESNDTADIEFETSTSYIISSGLIDGNRHSQDATDPSILMGAASGSTSSRVFAMKFGSGSQYGGSGSTTPFVVGDMPVHCTFEDLHVNSSDMSAVRRSRNRIYELHGRSVMTHEYSVACNEDKTAAAPVLITLPAGSTIHDITAHCTAAMDGTGAKTFEVGVSGTADKYIDQAEFDSSSLNDWQAMTGGGSNGQGTAEFLLSDTDILATWTNTGGTPSAGTVSVRITYSEDTGSSVSGVAVP